ncbi:MAG: ATP-dependent Clp protease proteolytic subunit [Pseudomonadota bacterium]
MSDETAVNSETGDRQSWLSRFPDDGSLLRYAFYIMLVSVVGVLVFDYREMITRAPVEIALPDNPVLPAYIPPSSNDQEQPERFSPTVKTERDILRQPLQVELAADGVLKVTGTISVGSSGTFAEKTRNIVEYIKVVELNSPGGSVSDALEISNLVREKGFATRVSDGALCASSCPLVLAGGKNRIAGEKAAIGVHQVYSSNGNAQSADRALSDGQSVTAQITRHLATMGVDPALWIHALETPPNQLYYLSNEEIEKFKLAEVSAE